MHNTEIEGRKQFLETHPDIGKAIIHKKRECIERKNAFMMAWHPRLGADSLIRKYVPKDVGKMIAKKIGIPVYLYDDTLDFAFCQLCGDVRRGENEIQIRHHPLDCYISPSCCESILCPYCVTQHKRVITACHMYVRNVIYLQCDEISEEDVILEEFEGHPVTSIQYQWGLYQHRDLKKARNDECSSRSRGYREVQWNYNDFGALSLRKDEGCTDIVAECVCDNCGFECVARNYKDI